VTDGAFQTTARADGAGWARDTGAVEHRTFAGPDKRAGMHTTLQSWRRTWRRVGEIEGKRGKAIRLSVAVRYVVYLLTVLAVAAVANASFGGTAWRLAGTLVLFSAAAMTVTAALGTMLVPHKRDDIVEDFRHFLFQVSLLPAAGIAVFQWVLRVYTDNPLNQDNFLNLLNNTLPLLFAFTVFVPAIVFIKAVAGRRMLDRTQQDDQELMQTWTRQDMFMP
jgi:hypothetical protein